MGIWDLHYLDSQVKKFQKLTLNPGFDDEQREKFRLQAIAAQHHLVEHMAGIEERVKKRERINSLTCPKCGQVGTLQRVMPEKDPGDDFDKEENPILVCGACRWSGLPELL
ncbi:unannotated protein [freshwater metagenome]|uniref:Unannotated protein n=1 Tax=freshwater metagenome TaxID=449393 RepID=A0A6J7T9D8_9ZZZZ|nr:hypothetical protein [Actinomycetota bacterium]MSX45512.1 hypothetical protein [Actinomycetota bacterium]MSX73935.1 hypothetical protein [Actinomycetota bacterium]MSZ01774.1 hypothetical protein [Actinomycetota bacterium]MTA60414.1 hypothetical protein [Actinomycetota bacterium]